MKQLLLSMNAKKSLQALSFKHEPSKGPEGAWFRRQNCKKYCYRLICLPGSLRGIVPHWFSLQNCDLDAGLVLIRLSLSPDFEVEQLPLHFVEEICSALASILKFRQLISINAHNFFANIVEGRNPSLAGVVGNSE